jgi:hypothetical protein
MHLAAAHGAWLMYGVRVISTGSSSLHAEKNKMVEIEHLKKYFDWYLFDMHVIRYVQSMYV